MARLFTRAWIARQRELYPGDRTQKMLNDTTMNGMIVLNASSELRKEKIIYENRSNL